MTNSRVYDGDGICRGVVDKNGNFFSNDPPSRFRISSITIDKEEIQIKLCPCTFVSLNKNEVAIWMNRENFSPDEFPVRLTNGERECSKFLLGISVINYTEDKKKIKEYVSKWGKERLDSDMRGLLSNMKENPKRFPLPFKIYEKEIKETNKIEEIELSKEIVGVGKMEGRH